MDLKPHEPDLLGLLTHSIRHSLLAQDRHVTPCRHPKDQIPPRTSSRSRQKARHASHTLPRVHDLSMNRIAQGSSGATTCPAAPAPAAQPGAAPGLPRVLQLQLPLPSPRQLRGRHVSCDSSSRCPAQGSSGAATCSLKAQRSMCY
jgi:hypothetical protein